MRAPFQRTSPRVGASSPHRIRNRLVLPLPFCPAMRSSSPAPSLKERPANSFRPPRSHSSSVASSTWILLQKGQLPSGEIAQWPLTYTNYGLLVLLALLQSFGHPDEDAVGERGEVLR